MLRGVEPERRKRFFASLRMTPVKAQITPVKVQNDPGEGSE
jgi:hypothetical protein